MAYHSNYRRIAKQMMKNKRRTLEAIGIYIRGETQIRSPVDTGNLRDSYDYAVDGDVVRIGTNTEYAPYVELGTRKMNAQPHLRPAVEENKTNISRLAAREMGRGLK